MQPTVTPVINFPTLFQNALPTFKFTGKTPGDVISDLLPYIFIIAGLILFGLLIFGGFSLMTSAGSPENTKKAQGKITSALIGFLIIFVAYWLAKILETIFKIQIF
jgi:uncharacterized membrane protein